MELGLLKILVVLAALQRTYSVLNGIKTTNLNTETEIIRNISYLKGGQLHWITNSKHEKIEQRGLKNEVVKPNPASIVVRPDSILYTDGSQEIVINFEVTNNQYKTIYYQFEGYTENSGNRVDVRPTSSGIPPYSTTIVTVKIFPRSFSSDTNRGLLKFVAKWQSFFEEEVTQEVYYYIGKQNSDSTGPTITYSFKGECSGYFHPKQCHNKIWKADISIQDSDSGLLYIKSDPIGLLLNKKFIVGTKEEVSGYYRAYCCQSKVDITATDVSGNEYTISIDIEKKWLSTGDIISIILGSTLLIILIASIIVCIVCLCKRKRQTLSLYPETLRS